MKICKINVKNFLTFEEFEFKVTENFNMIYGENGIGKSTFIEIFSFLDKIFNKDKLIKREYTENFDEGNVIRDKKIFNLYENYSTKESTDPIEISLEFEHEGKRGKYDLVLNNYNEVEYERLMFNVGKRISRIFEKNGEKVFIHQDFKAEKTRFSYLFEDKKSSFIGVMNLLMSDGLVSENKKPAQKIVVLLINFIVLNDRYGRQKWDIQEKEAMIPEITVKKEVYEDFEKIYAKYTKSLKELLTIIDDKIVGVDYNYESLNDDNQRRYFLIIKKKYKNSIKNIAIGEESSGTQRYLDYLNALMTLKDGDKIIFWDEIGIHLHETLAEKLISFIFEVAQQEGNQIFMTVHHTALLDIDEISNKSKIVMMLDLETGHRRMETFMGTDKKLKKSKKYKEETLSKINQRFSKIQ